MSGEMQWHRWWRTWSDDEDWSDQEQQEEKWREDPVLKKIRILKSMHEKKLNKVNLLQQEIQNSPNLSTAQIKVAEKEVEAAKTAAAKAENKLLEFAKSKNKEPYSENEKLLKEMRRETSSLDGAWNLHRSSLKKTRGMSKEQILKVCDMKEKGAENLNFQFSIGPGFQPLSDGSDLWAVELKVKRGEKNNVKKRGKSKRQKISTVKNIDTVDFNFFYQDHPTWAPGPGFQIYVLNSDNKVIKVLYMTDSCYNRFPVDLDQLKTAGQKISDVTYKIVVNVFEAEEEEPLEDSDEDSDNDSDKDSDENSDEDSDY